jgi:hypothetical protein
MSTEASFPRMIAGDGGAALDDADHYSIRRFLHLP